MNKEEAAMPYKKGKCSMTPLGCDPRWGRIEETYGEASLLVGAMGEAYVKGLLT